MQLDLELLYLILVIYYKYQSIKKQYFWFELGGLNKEIEAQRHWMMGSKLSAN